MNEQNREVLALLGVKQTNFFTIEAPSNDTLGAPIGIGACKAVILKFNYFNRNVVPLAANAYSINITDFPASSYVMYYGDRNRQEVELFAGLESPILFVRDLQDIWVRIATATVAAIAAKGLPVATVQVQVYS